MCCLKRLPTLFLVASPLSFLLAPSLAWAAAAEGSETLKWLVIGLVVVATLVIGQLIYGFSQKDKAIKAKAETPEAPAAPTPAIYHPKAVVPSILDQLAQAGVNPKQREQLAQSLSTIVTKTVDAQVDAVKQEVKKHYDQVLEEKQWAERALQRKYQEALIDRNQTAQVLESIAEGLVVVNNKGEVVMMNPAAEKLLAVRQAERVGKPLVESLDDDQIISLVQGSTEGREIVVNTKQESTKRVLRASNAVVTDQDGRAVGMVAVLHDVTKQKEVEDLKSEFVSKVSHELRTPLMAIQYALSLLDDQMAGSMSEDAQAFVSLTRRNLERLNLLVSDLLDLSKLEAKKMELRLELIALGPILQTVCDTMDAWAKSKQITLVRRVVEEVPMMRLDASRLIQVLTNLVGNAIKFTPEKGKITVEGKLAADQQHVEVSVIDTGVGIAPEDLPKLFNKFQQVGERTASDMSGTGLGLVIAKEIVELHQGRIWVESDGKRGARFVFTLPLHAAAAA
jgi:two-component system phosphate regulon sensor histidine kinase PhoR